MYHRWLGASYPWSATSLGFRLSPPTPIARPYGLCFGLLGVAGLPAGRKCQLVVSWLIGDRQWRWVLPGFACGLLCFLLNVNVPVNPGWPLP